MPFVFPVYLLKEFILEVHVYSSENQKTQNQKMEPLFESLIKFKELPKAAAVLLKENFIILYHLS